MAAGWELASGIRLQDATRYVSEGGQSNMENTVLREFQGDYFFFFAFLEQAMACNSVVEYSRYFQIPHLDELYIIIRLLQCQPCGESTMSQRWKKRVVTYRQSLQIPATKKHKNLDSKPSSVTDDKANNTTNLSHHIQEETKKNSKNKDMVVQQPRISVPFSHGTVFDDNTISVSPTASPAVPLLHTAEATTGSQPRETKGVSFEDGTSTKSKLLECDSVKLDRRYELLSSHAGEPIVMDKNKSGVSPSADTTTGTGHQPIVFVDNSEKMSHDDPLRALPNNKWRWFIMDYVVREQFEGDYFSLFRTLDQTMAHKGFSSRAFMRQHNIPESGKFTLLDIVRLLQNRNTFIVSPLLTQRVQAYQRARAMKLSAKTCDLSSSHEQKGTSPVSEASPVSPLNSSTNRNAAEGIVPNTPSKRKAPSAITEVAEDVGSATKYRRYLLHSY